MPVQGFGESYLQGQSLANERRKVQLAAEKQERLNLFQDKVVDANERVNEIAAGAAQAISGLEERLGESNTRFQMLQLKEAASGMLGGDLSSLSDAFQDPELKEVFMQDDGIKDFFDNQSGLVGVRPYNPNNPEEVKAHDRYIEDIGGGTPDFDATAVDENIFTYQMADGSVSVYDRTAVARALGLGAEFTSIRNKIEEQDKIDEDLMKRKTDILNQEKQQIVSQTRPDLAQAKRDLLTAQQNLAAVDTSYKAPEEEKPPTALDNANLRKVLLQNEKLAQEIRAAGAGEPANLIEDLPVLGRFAQTKEQLATLLVNSGDYSQEQADKIAATAFPAIEAARDLATRETEAGITQKGDAAKAKSDKEQDELEIKTDTINLGSAVLQSEGIDTTNMSEADILARGEEARKNGTFVNSKGEVITPDVREVRKQTQLLSKVKAEDATPEASAIYAVNSADYDEAHGTSLQDNPSAAADLLAAEQIADGSIYLGENVTGGEKGIVSSNVANPIIRALNVQQAEAARESLFKLSGYVLSQNIIQGRSTNQIVRGILGALNADSWTANEVAAVDGLQKALGLMRSKLVKGQGLDGNIYRKGLQWQDSIDKVDAALKALDLAKIDIAKGKKKGRNRNVPTIVRQGGVAPKIAEGTDDINSYGTPTDTNK